jgi:hypothetical protein
MSHQQTLLDSTHILKKVFDESTESIRTSFEPTSAPATAINQQEEITYLQEIANNSRFNTKGFSQLTPGYPKVVTVSTTSSVILPANPNRVYVHIIHQGNSAVYLQYLVDAQLQRGITLLPGGLYTISGNDLWLGIVTAISTSNQEIEVLEGIE